MRKIEFVVMVAAVLVLAGCHGHETITGGYGNAGVAGVVTMAAGMPNGSPAGVRVVVGGTGMSAVLGTDGRFAFYNVPDTVDLIFQRGDTNAHLRAEASPAPLAIELGPQEAHLRRGRSVPSTVPTEVEGLIVSVSDTQIVVHDSHGNDVTMVINGDTVIRKGQTPLQPSDLKAGDRVHVKSMVDGNAVTALLIVLQNPDGSGDDQGQARWVEIEGTITSVSDTQLVVHDSHGNDDTLVVDSNTVIRKGGQVLLASDLQTGEQVHVKAVTSGDTLTALLVILQNNEDHNVEMEVHGTVSAVGTSDLTVNGVTVQVDASTDIRKRGQSIALGDIHTGDTVEANGTRVDDNTMLARQINVEDSSHH
ncbi:MAG TPA: DUF5666 domain-containing protein [Thermoanaerobaculia bacterium]|nr:DUF5666 domain-containing protein [Thermoanaerobaculia bacterium]